MQAEPSARTPGAPAASGCAGKRRQVDQRLVHLKCCTNRTITFEAQILAKTQRRIATHFGAVHRSEETGCIRPW